MSKLSHYNLIWRWHFYAGLIVLPVVLTLAITGGLYLFQQEIENWLYKDLLYVQSPYEGVVDHDAIVAVAKKSVGSTDVKSYQPAVTANESAQVVVVTPNQGALRIFVNPSTLAVQGTLNESSRLMNIARQLHKELMLGTPGRYITELVACWLIVLIFSGIYLWWPRKLPKRGIFRPDTSNTDRSLLREFHAVFGIWASVWILMLLLAGLPWTVFWGSALDTVAGDEALPHAIFKQRPLSRSDAGLAEISMNTLMQRAQAEGTHHGFRIEYPWAANGTYAVTPLRHCDLDQITYLFFDRSDDSLIDAYHWKDLGKVGRATSIGVAFHEGRLFGKWNQWINLMAVLMVIFLCISGPIMWWKRKPANAFGAPSVPSQQRITRSLAVIMAILGILLPLFGISLLLILCCEATCKRRLSKQ
ncbi:MAG TPA: PepSY domain-containing protein [Pseudomonadales bacterium]|nr:PepSY domain-containing protein [Pseudomonadales bacterium]